MRIALISDIHGNAIALHAVLDDIRRVGVDGVVCLGDVATLGPDPGTVVQMLQELACPCIMGNHDEFLIEPALVSAYTDRKPVIDAVTWCREELTEEQLTWMRTFRSTHRLELNGGALLAFHGSPQSNVTDIVATTSAAALDELLEGVTGTVLAGGHTHVAMLRQHRGVLLVNPGSVGLPFRQHVAGGVPTLLDHAEYAIVDSEDGRVGVSLWRVPLERRALHRAAHASTMPLRDFLINQYH